MYHKNPNIFVSDQEAFQKQCLTYLVKIKKRIEDQDREIADIKKMLETMVQKGNSVTNLPEIEDLGILNLLPASDEKMIATLEESFSDKNTHDKMVSIFCIISDTNIQVSI